jgi:hypothetical protein
MASPLKDAAWLAWIERLATESPTELPPGCFHCRLDDQPDHLAPVPLMQRQAWEDLAGRPLFLHPDCWISREGRVPPEIGESLPYLDNFALQGHMVWLRDQATQMIQPFWLGQELGSQLGDLRPGDPIPRGISPELRRTLMMAGILVREDFVADRRQRWIEILLRSCLEFRQKQYSPLRGLLHPFHVAALRRYFRHLVRKGALRLGDSQSSRRFIAHNESVLRFFHQQLTGIVSAVAGEKVKPSYVYLGAYQGGARLEKHTDREQCEFSVTFCLDYSPEPRMETPWPIQLHPSSGTVTVFQAIGDGLFYRGCRVPHSRTALPEGHSSTSIFFHYVRGDFDGPLD